MSQTGILIDEILVAVRDSRWHDVSEITARVKVDEKYLEAVLSFMNDFRIIERSSQRIRINRKVSGCLSNE